MARRERIEIEGHLFGRVHASRLAAEDGVLLALLRARVIEVVAAAVRDGLVVLLDARQHLRVERVDERRRGLHDRFGVGVLRAEVRHHLGIVLPAKPEIVVRAPITVHGVDPGNPSGGGRRRRRGGGSGVVAHGTAGHSTTGKRGPPALALREDGHALGGEPLQLLEHQQFRRAHRMAHRHAVSPAYSCVSGDTGRAGGRARGRCYDWALFDGGTDANPSPARRLPCSSHALVTRPAAAPAPPKAGASTSASTCTAMSTTWPPTRWSSTPSHRIASRRCASRTS